MTKPISRMTTSEIFAQLNSTQKDELYRMLWSDYVYGDVMEVLKSNNDVSEEDYDDIANSVTNSYVYNGRYDCNLSYWDNINNLVNENM